MKQYRGRQYIFIESELDICDVIIRFEVHRFRARYSAKLKA